jgi:hypothetical protein
MKNPANPGGADLCPKADWGKWRANRDKRIQQPRRLKTVKDKKDSGSTSGEPPK